MATPELIETCCWNDPRDQCIGTGCACGCHATASAMSSDERCAWLQQQVADRDRFIALDRSIIEQRDKEIVRLTTERDKAQAIAASLSEDWHRTQKVLARLRNVAVDLTTAYLEDPYVTLDEMKPRIVALIEELDGVGVGR